MSTQTEQAELFDRAGPRDSWGRHPGTRRRWKPSGSLGRQAQRAALDRLRADGRADALRARYARLLYRAATSGVEIRGVTVYSLTDLESAHLLGCARTSINARRAELQGRDDALPEYARCPVVEEHERRASLIRPSGTDNTAYRFRTGLFEKNHENHD